MWEPKLPKDYKEIILMSKTPDVYSMSKKKDIYDMLLKGILVQQGNVVIIIYPIFPSHFISYVLSFMLVLFFTK